MIKKWKYLKAPLTAAFGGVTEVRMHKRRTLDKRRLTPTINCRVMLCFTKVEGRKQKVWEFNLSLKIFAQHIYTT